MNANQKTPTQWLCCTCGQPASPHHNPFYGMKYEISPCCGSAFVQELTPTQLVEKACNNTEWCPKHVANEIATKLERLKKDFAHAEQELNRHQPELCDEIRMHRDYLRRQVEELRQQLEGNKRVMGCGYCGETIWKYNGAFPLPHDVVEQAIKVFESHDRICTQNPLAAENAELRNALNRVLQYLRQPDDTEAEYIERLIVNAMKENAK